jgi:ribosome-binding protein aMBF1 (putative translation factor)
MNEEKIVGMLEILMEKIDRLEQRVGHPEAEQKKEWTPEELAQKTGRKPFTVREWARNGRVPSRKDMNGRRWINDEIARKIIAYGGLPPKGELVA